MRHVYLSLNQGTTIVRDEFGAAYVDELGHRAQVMRARLLEYRAHFSVTAIDLADMMPPYLQLRSRGGVHQRDASEDEAADEHAGTVIERRRYRLHRTIERSSSASRKAKSVHGYICQGCGFGFETIYGAVEHEFIEAHHLTPLADLPEDIPVSLDPRDDFALLCANCHRMIAPERQLSDDS